MVKPTVLVGIGGVGKNVLLRLRKMFVEEYRSLERLPAFQFLHIDTFGDEKPEGVDDIPKTVLGENIYLSGNKVSLSEHPDLGDTDILKNSGEISEWYDNSLPFPENLIVGAGAVRMHGRLGFHYHVDRFREALQILAMRAREGSAKTVEALGIDLLERGINIYIACSFFGGTASGCFLEACYNAREALKAFNPEILGFFVIGAAVGDFNEAMKANCYGALKELEHYSTVRMDETLDNFNVAYPIPGISRLTSDRPPVDACYLFDAQNDAGRPFNREELEELVARRIFFEFDPVIGPELQGKRPDIMQASTGYFEPDTVLKRTQTFFGTGLSTIEFPAGRIRNALSYDMAANICNHLLYSKAPGFEDLQAAVNGFKLDNKLAARPLLDSLLENLRSTVNIDLDNWKRTADGQIQTDKGSFDADGVVTAIEQNVVQAKSRTSAHPGTQGTYVADIVARKDSIHEELEKNVTNKVSQLVGDKVYGPGQTLKYLEQLIRDLSLVQNGFEKSSGSAERRAREAMDKLDERFRRLKDDLKYKYRWELRQHNKWLHQRELARYVRLSVDKVAYSSARNLIGDTTKLITDLKHKVEEYVNRLKTYAAEFEAHRDEILNNLIKTGDSIVGIPKESLEEMRDYLAREREKYISISSDDNTIQSDEAEKIVQSVYKELKTHVFSAILEETSFKEELVAECDKRCSNIENTSVVSMVSEGIIDSKISESQICLRTGGIDRTTSHLPSLHRKGWIALDPNAPKGAGLADGLSRHTRVQSQPYRMVLAQEMGVFPLRCVSLVPDLQDAYNYFTGPGRIRRTTDKRVEFRELLPANPAIVGIYDRAKTMSILGRILGFLKEEKDPQTGYPAIFLRYQDTGRDKICEEQDPKKDPWDAVIGALAEPQINKEVHGQNPGGGLTSLEKLEAEVSRKGEAATTKSQREQLWTELNEYMVSYLEQLTAKLVESGSNKDEAREAAIKTTLYQQMREIVEDYCGKYKLYQPTN